MVVEDHDDTAELTVRTLKSGGYASPIVMFTGRGTQRGALRERIRAKLPIARDGSIDLIARAWAFMARHSDAASSSDV